MIGAKIKSSYRLRKIKFLYEKYERVLIPGTLILGVAVDFVTFRSIEILTAFKFLVAYLVIAGATIAFTQIYDERKRDDNRAILRYARLASPLLLQFTFGALLSASLIFYWFSGSISVSWPIMIVLAMLMASNEVLRHYFLRPVVQIGVLYFIVFSILALLFPYIFNSIDPSVFLISGVASLFVMLIYIQSLSNYVDTLKQQRSGISIVVVAIFASMNAMYFTNIIPPIPLSLTEAGVYHSVERVNGGYVVVREKEGFLDSVLPGQTIHLERDERVYVFASIFAPTDLNTTIFHDWQYFDPNTRRWTSQSRPSYNIYEGRDQGYRGFSFSNNVRPGLWRVNIETKRGQIMGRVRFNVEQAKASVELEELIK